MKERILGNLYKFSRISDFEEAMPMFLEISKDLGINEPTLQERAKRTLKEILHNYAFYKMFSRMVE